MKPTTMTQVTTEGMMRGNGGAADDRRNGTITANGVTPGVEHVGDAAAPPVPLAGGTTMLSRPDALREALARGGRAERGRRAAPSGR